MPPIKRQPPEKAVNNKKAITKDYLNKSTLIVNKVSDDSIDEPEK